MKLPTNFKSVISSTFYDKIITLYTSEVQKDEYGWTGASATATADTFMGNVRFNNLAQVQEDYGIEEAIDIAVTTDEDVANSSIIGYDGKTYKIVKVIPSDSHNLIVANLWESKSSTLTSV